MFSRQTQFRTVGRHVAGVTIRVVNPDGGEGGHTLDPQEWELQDSALKLLLAHGAFQKAHPGAVLRHVECHRSPADALQGRMGLHFAVPGQAPCTIWARWGKHSRVIFKRGRVTVAVD